MERRNERRPRKKKNYKFKQNFDTIKVMDLTTCLDRIFNYLKSRSHLLDDGTSYTMPTELLMSGMEEKDIYNADIKYVMEKLHLCEEEIQMLSCILGDPHCDTDDISKYLNCSNIEFIRYRKFLRSLCVKRLIRPVHNRFNCSEYAVNPELYDVITENREMTPRVINGISTEEMFTEFRKLFKSRHNDDIEFDDLYSELMTLIELNGQNKFVQLYDEYKLKECSKTEQVIFLYLCHQYVSWALNDKELSHLECLIDPLEDERRFHRYFANENLMFQKLGLVEFGGTGEFEDKDAVGLTQTVRDNFFTEVELLDVSASAMQHKDLHSPDKIVEKQMYYNPKEGEQVGRLEKLLEAENFASVQNRLVERGMRKGFNVILYGGPGTGKTETVMQIAKKTGREIFCIDVSKIKNKYVGESEKSIKGAFDLYRRFCKGKKVQPILLFNEADAIFGRRLESVNSSADQMSNSIQNIILQEMETLEGILVATTNLHANLDAAFERRFLYKIEFNMPEAEVRSKLWKNMLPGLDDQHYTALGKKYNFSGGQIENISRKSTVDYILSGTEVCVDKIEKYCEEEIFVAKRKKVGYLLDN
ncbi:MAG: ATP-binding protein [Paludibacteraceae bacterium]|nr:ATP-binding protein [Paludibacteraceae bacterium]